MRPLGRSQHCKPARGGPGDHGEARPIRTPCSSIAGLLGLRRSHPRCAGKAEQPPGPRDALRAWLPPGRRQPRERDQRQIPARARRQASTAGLDHRRGIRHEHNHLRGTPVEPAMGPACRAQRAMLAESGAVRVAARREVSPGKLLAYGAYDRGTRRAGRGWLCGTVVGSGRPGFGVCESVMVDGIGRASARLSYSGSVTSTAPNPGSGPSTKKISMVMSGSTWAWERKATTLRPVSSRIVSS